MRHDRTGDQGRRSRDGLDMADPAPAKLHDLRREPVCWIARALQWQVVAHDCDRTRMTVISRTPCTLLLDRRRRRSAYAPGKRSAEGIRPGQAASVSRQESRTRPLTESNRSTTRSTTEPAFRRFCVTIRWSGHGTARHNPPDRLSGDLRDDLVVGVIVQHSDPLSLSHCRDQLIWRHQDARGADDRRPRRADRGREPDRQLHRR